MPNIPRAFNESVLEHFIIKPITATREPETVICGRISLCVENVVYIQITEGITELFPWNEEDFQRFDIIFIKNRTSFQLQHNALDYVKEYNLFPILINHPKYAENEHQLSQLPMSQSNVTHDGKLR